jgi:hypothetical protein
MDFTILTREKNNIMYTITYRHLPVFELGIKVPTHDYYIQYVDKYKHDIFDTSYDYKKISFGDVMELSQDKISAILETIIIMNELEIEIKH